MWKYEKYRGLSLAAFGILLLNSLVYADRCLENSRSIHVSPEFWSPEKANIVTRQLECSRPDFYICEEPPESAAEERSKLCSYRGVLYTQQIYRWVAGRGCLLYTPDFLFVDGANPISLNAACLHGTLYAPCVELAKPDGTCGCFPFDPSFQEVVAVVEESLLASALGRWERCYQAASDCCTNVMTDADSITEEGRCGATFDGWACWEAAPADTVVTQVCPEFAYTNTGPTCNHFSSKNCTASSTWDIQTEYGTCSITPLLIKRNRYYIWALAASTILCVPAIVVFFFYKRLRVTRVALHRNLIVALVFRNVLVIVTRSEVYLDELVNASDTAMSTHSWPCRALAVLERASVNLVFVCMLVEGVYLHRLICAVFRREYNIKLLYSVGAGITIIPVIAWAVVMALLDDHSCWMVYTVPYIQWTLDGPRIAILLANTILLLDILRVLLTKIRNSENANQLSTAKATLFLMPLFGVQFLLTAYRPNATSCAIEQGYYIFTYTMEALQGVIVAALYCYANKEVHNLITTTYKKTENAVVSLVHRDSNYRRPTLGMFSNRRETCSTALDPSPVTPADKQPHPLELPPLKQHTIQEVSPPNQKLASLLDPIAEYGISNDGFDYSEISKNSESTPKENNDDNDSKTTGKTDETIECHDWIKCVSSPTSSIYDNSLNEYEIRYLEENKKKSSDHAKCDDDNKVSEVENSKDVDDISFSDFIIPDAVEDIDGSEIFNQMLKTAIARKASRNSNSKDVILNSNALSPNRLESEKIIFVDE